LSVNRIIFLPEITDDEVKEFQAEDANLGPIVEWLKDGRQPTPDYLKSKSLDTRTLWAQVPAIHLLDGILVHKFSDQCMIQLVIPTVTNTVKSRTDGAYALVYRTCMVDRRWSVVDLIDPG